MTTDSLTEKSRGDLWLASLIFLTGLIFGVLYHVSLWNLDTAGLSTISKRLPYWDFTNLWAGARLALDGHVEFLFDAEGYRAALRAMFTPALPDQEWSYPPSMLIIGLPLALLPISIAYLVWTVGTLALLHLAIRPLRLPLAIHLAALLSPAVFINAMFGQNGALTAALLIGGLLAAPKRPILAGFLFGLLTVKPQIGILIPFCLIASGNWRAIASASTTAALLAAATGWAFGFAVWPSFFAETRALMTAIMEAPYPQSYHGNAVTVFIMARSAGASVNLAYLFQLAATLVAICVVVWLWLPSAPVDHRRRALITAALAIVATPYGYTYDTIPMCVALAYMFAVTLRPSLLAFAAAWFFPLFAHLLNYNHVGAGILVPIAVVIWMLPRVRGAGRARYSQDGLEA